MTSTNYESLGFARPRDAEAIIEAARQIATPAALDPETPLAFVLPSNARVEIPDLRAWRSRPTRKTGTYLPATVSSLIEYVNRHYDETHTTVWVHPSSGQVVAVLDDHAPDEPAWGDHRAVLTLEPTPEWLFWCRYDGELRSQETFAEHIEEGMPEIVEPDGATMLELAQNFHATTDATFRSSVRLSSGQQQLQYDQEVQATAGRAGDLKVPTMFLLAISPFVGEDPYKVAARLRFRLTGGKLMLGYWLDRPDKIKRDAIEQIAERITAQFPRTYIGSYSG